MAHPSSTEDEMKVGGKQVDTRSSEQTPTDIPTAVRTKLVLKLIVAHVQDNRYDFKKTAMEIAHELELNNKTELALYIYAQFGETRTFEIND